MRDKLLAWTLALLFLSGVPCSRWKAEYQQQLVCAVKGSTVAIHCSIYNPENQEVTVLWGRQESSQVNRIRILIDSSVKVFRNFQYIGDTQQNCSLKIHQVMHHQAGTYIVFFNQIRSPSSVELKVVDLNISLTKPHGNGVLKEGDSARLTCANACDDSKNFSTFTWFKNGESIHEGTSLFLGNMTSIDSGTYTCSLKTFTGTTSGAVRIDVEYGPKNTSVSVRPPAAADVGGGLTLVCSSHANPPVENYTWFKKGGNGSISVGRQLVLDPADTGQLFCSVANKHGSQNSSVHSVNSPKEKDYPPKVSKELFIIAAVAAFLLVTVIIALTRLSQRRMREAIAECDEDKENSDYVNWLTCEPIQLHDRHLCEEVIPEVEYTPVYCHNKRPENLEERRSSQHECVVYSTVCSEHSLNSSYTEPL